MKRPPSPGSPPRIALVGLPGSGKTSVGRLLAEALACPFLDTDDLVTDQATASVEEIFRRSGERAFRDLETNVLSEAAQIDPPLVLATGGGIVEAPQNRKKLAERFFVVWLRVEPEVAAARAGGGPVRPLLDEKNALAALRSLAARRDPWYRDVADLVLDTGNAAGSGETVARIQSALHPPQQRR